MHGLGTSKRRSAPCGRALRSSTAAAMIRTRTATSHLWTTACRASWASAWSCPRTSTTAMRCGWRERSSPSPFNGRGCCRIPDRGGEEKCWEGWRSHTSGSRVRSLWRRQEYGGDILQLKLKCACGTGNIRGNGY